MSAMRRWIVGAVSCLLAMGAMAAVTPEPETLTVGDLAVNLTRMINQKGDVSPEQALDYLSRLGVDLSGDINSPVSEESLVEAFNSLGISLTTSDPEHVLTTSDGERIFRMFDRKDSLFSSEQFRLCKGGADNQNKPCLSDSDCPHGFCQTLSSIKCAGGPMEGQSCMTDGDCPDSTCNIPPGQAKKLGIASPSD